MAIEVQYVLKNDIIENNLVITNFQGEKIGTFFNDNIELIFGRTEENEYVMIIKEKSVEEYVNLEDIEYIKMSEKFDDALDICYVVKKVFNLNFFNLLISKKN